MSKFCFSAVRLRFSAVIVPAAVAAALLASSSALLAQSAPSSEAAKVAAGSQTYADYCSSCHGEELRNTSGGVTFDLRRLKPEEHPRFLNSVLNGKNQMPPWRGALSEDQIESIWAYIRSVNDKPQ